MRLRFRCGEIPFREEQHDGHQAQDRDVAHDDQNHQEGGGYFPGLGCWQDPAVQHDGNQERRPNDSYRQYSAFPGFWRAFPCGYPTPDLFNHCLNFCHQILKQVANRFPPRSDPGCDPKAKLHGTAMSTRGAYLRSPTICLAWRISDLLLHFEAQRLLAI